MNMDASFTKPINSIIQAFGDLTLHAQYGRPVEPENPSVGDKYTITYINGEQKINLEPPDYTSGSVAQLPKYETDNFTFGGWYTSPTFEEETRIQYIDGSMSGNLKLYVKLIPIDYKITYVINGGTNHPDNITSYTVNDFFTFLAPERKYYTFSGWYTDSEFNNRIDSTEGLSGDIVLYAKWIETSIII